MGGIGGSIPPVLLTDNQGASQRLRVDVGKTSFFSGREFRTFKEFSAATQTYVVKVVTPIDIILFELAFELEEGSARVLTYVGGTGGGTFSEDLPRIPANSMSEAPQPAYTSQITTVAAGGTYNSDGTQIDVFRVKTDANSNKAASVDGHGFERGVPAGTYYFVLQLTGATGVFRARWEERVGY